MECAHIVVPEATEQALRYYHSGNMLWIIQQGWSLILPFLFLITRFSGKLSAVAERWGRKWFFTIVIYLILFVAFYTLFNLPLDFYAGYLREHAYGLSTQTLGRWFDNYSKGAMVTLVTSILFVWVFYLLLKKSPRRWWFYSALASTAILFILMFIQPIWIDPLFNKFGPMKDKKLEAQILDLAHQAGIKDGKIFEVDKSQDTKALNAYVVGFGSSKRIVLWDTLIKQMTPDQVLFVMGHEMGHYVLHHLWWSLGYFALFFLVVFYLIYRSTNFLLERYRFGFSHLYNIASVPLLLLLMNFFTLLFTPLTNGFSRYFEHEADRFGLEITQNNQAAGESFLIWQKENLANPRPGVIFKTWRSTHPSIGDRVDFFNSYCPWQEGVELKYEKYFTSP